MGLRGTHRKPEHRNAARPIRLPPRQPSYYLCGTPLTSSVNRAAGAPLSVSTDQVAKGWSAGAVLADLFVWDLAVWGSCRSAFLMLEWWVLPPVTQNPAPQYFSVLPPCKYQHRPRSFIHASHRIRWWSSKARQCSLCRSRCPQATLVRTLDGSVVAAPPSCGRPPAARAPGRSRSMRY
jgi:hypothetical protein